jgi:hypothetical protein
MTAATFCPRCGTARTGDMRYCASCAYDFQSKPEAGYSTFAPKPDASGWTYTPAVPAVPAKQGRSGIERLLIVAIVVVGGLAGAYLFLNSNAGIGPTKATNDGRIVFGATYNSSTLAIVGEQTQFPLSTKSIAWSASFKEPAGATKLTVLVASVTSAGAETIVDTAEVAISNPSFDRIANSGDLVSVVGGKAGTYVMRYLRGATILAEGRFTLA